jgi:hypothetical protein
MESALRRVIVPIVDATEPLFANLPNFLGGTTCCEEVDRCMKVKAAATKAAATAARRNERNGVAPIGTPRSPAATSCTTPSRESPATTANVTAPATAFGAASSEQHCADCTGKYRAATDTSSMSERHDHRGLFGIFCAHGFMLMGILMGAGEKYAYCCMALLTIMKEQQCPIDFCWYDIGPCKFYGYFIKWIDS